MQQQVFHPPECAKHSDELIHSKATVYFFVWHLSEVFFFFFTLIAPILSKDIVSFLIF